MSLRFKGSGGKTSGKGCGLLFGIGWTLFSSIFVVVGIGVFWNSEKVRAWDELPCVIDRFEIAAEADADPPFTADLVYRYRVDGRWIEGTKLRNSESGEDDYEDLHELREEILAGEPTCRVNPDDPGESVLLAGGAESWFGLVFAAFGGCFVLVGIGLITGMLRGEKSRQAKSASEETKMGGLLGCGFFGLFAAAGVGMFAAMVVPKAIEYLAMQSWQEVPAEVIWSRVRSHSSDDGTTYSADVFYRYDFEGKEYRSNRRGLIGGSSSGRSGKQEFVRQHPPGKSVVCYVDPDQPWRATLERKLGWWALFALFPVPFAAIGLGGLWWTFFGSKAKERKARSGSGKTEAAPEDPGLVTKSGSVGRRVLHVFGALALAAFWNGIVSVFVWQVREGWQKGESPWFLTLFMIPFVLVGLGLIAHVFYRIFAIFSPRYRVAIDQRRLPPGGKTVLSWEREGGGGTPRRLSLWLIGREEATYRRGTNTTTDTAIFHETPLFETEDRMTMPTGRVEVKVPGDAVPSFRGQHNKVRWFVLLLADVPGRPDVRDEYEIEVRPQP